MQNERSEMQTQGKPLRELRAIVEADNRRFWQLGELWGSLSMAQQLELIATAREMVKS